MAPREQRDKSILFYIKVRNLNVMLYFISLSIIVFLRKWLKRLL